MLVGCGASDEEIAEQARQEVAAKALALHKENVRLAKDEWDADSNAVLSNLDGLFTSRSCDAAYTEMKRFKKVIGDESGGYKTNESLNGKLSVCREAQRFYDQALVSAVSEYSGTRDVKNERKAARVLYAQNIRCTIDDIYSTSKSNTKVSAKDNSPIYFMDCQSAGKFYEQHLISSTEIKSYYKSMKEFN